MEFRLLQYVVTIAEELSFTQAAKKLYISQPALSRQVRELETQLGVQLFERSTRQVELTEAGKAFVDEAREALAHSKRAGSVAQALSRNEAEPVAVGYSPHFNLDLLNLIRQRSIERFGEEGARFASNFTSEQMESVLAARLDVGLAVLPAEHPKLETIVLLEDPVGLVVASNHRLCKLGNRKVHLADLKDEPVILLPGRLHPELYREVFAFWRSIGFQPKVTQEVTTIAEVSALVASGVGISFTKFSARNVMPPTIRMLELHEEERPVIKMAALARKTGRSRKTDRFLNMLRNVKMSPEP